MSATAAGSTITTGATADRHGARKVTDARYGEASHFAGSSWKWIMARGVLAILVAIVAFLFPFPALIAFTLVFAAFAFLDGVLTLASGMRGGPTSWTELILRGILGIAVGVIFVLVPLVAVVGYALATLAILIAWALVTGVLEIVAAVRLRKEIEGEWLLGLSGVLSILLGIAIAAFLFLFPEATLLSVAWIIGLFLLVAGIALIVQANRLRRISASTAA